MKVSFLCADALVVRKTLLDAVVGLRLEDVLIARRSRRSPMFLESHTKHE